MSMPCCRARTTTTGAYFPAESASTEPLFGNDHNISSNSSPVSSSTNTTQWSRDLNSPDKGASPLYSCTSQGLNSLSTLSVLYRRRRIAKFTGSNIFGERSGSVERAKKLLATVRSNTQMCSSSSSPTGDTIERPKPEAAFAKPFFVFAEPSFIEGKFAFRRRNKSNANASTRSGAPTSGLQETGCSRGEESKFVRTWSLSSTVTSTILSVSSSNWESTPLSASWHNVRAYREICDDVAKIEYSRMMTSMRLATAMAIIPSVP
mmetsp:Transcript_75073/g.188984  ORF Transcript_75073/g.188984 Transcript_75073/m.188984 type:complete len:263 (-) Transcript_75073:192-980(-)